jgi:hypothetical protein
MITALALLLATGADASSHREAPAIALDPAADLTDFYMFRDPNDTSKIVFIMNVNPLEEPGGGPNFHRFDDNVLYAIHVDNEGDAEEDIVYQVQFSTTYAMPDTFLYNLGDVANASNLNMKQTYTVTEIRDGVSSVILTSGDVAPTNVGVASAAAGEYNPESTTPGSITTAYIETQGGNKFFAGPRQEGFYVDLEHTFDLLNLASGEGNKNTLLGKNVHSIAIEVPATTLTLDGAAPSSGAQNNIIAAWATTSRRAVTVRRTGGVDTADRGGWVQVSRLGNPLVNEVVIPVARKDIFNASNPQDDLQFLADVQTSLLATYMNAILGTSCPATYDAGLGIGGREDLILAFLTGHPTLGTLWPGFSLGGAIPGEPTKNYAAFEALRIDLSGAGFGQWPDGRNVGDDVVDTALSAVCGLLVDGTTIPDGVDSTGLSYLSTFPFLGDPWAGDDHPSSGHDL